jgi:hypothetical protein
MHRWTTVVRLRFNESLCLGPYIETIKANADFHTRWWLLARFLLWGLELAMVVASAIEAVTVAEKRKKQKKVVIREF